MVTFTIHNSAFCTQKQHKKSIDSIDFVTVIRFYSFQLSYEIYEIGRKNSNFLDFDLVNVTSLSTSMNSKHRQRKRTGFPCLHN